jgi:hypothetical protein
MKKLTKRLVPAVVMLSFAFTGAFASGPDEDPGKPDRNLEATTKGHESAEQKAKKPQNASRTDTRMEKSMISREFMMALHDAEQKFKRSEREASRLQGDELRAAMRKAGEEMTASIEKAEDDKDAAMQVLEPQGDYTRKKKDRIMRKFNQAVRDAERKFKKAEKDASSLQVDESKAAMQQATTEKTAAIKKAEKDKDAAIKDIKPHSNIPEGKKSPSENEIKEGKSSMENQRAKQAGNK